MVYLTYKLLFFVVIIIIFSNFLQRAVKKKKKKEKTRLIQKHVHVVGWFVQSLTGGFKENKFRGGWDVMGWFVQSLVGSTPHLMHESCVKEVDNSPNNLYR